MSDHKDAHDRQLDELKGELIRFIEERSAVDPQSREGGSLRSRALTEQELEEITEHLAAERKAKHAAILSNLLDLIDRAGTTVGSLSLIALFFADKTNTQGTLLVASTSKPLWGAAFGFLLALVASYCKAILTWRDK
ncbi:hypothetical protein [Halomonas huangheensis]|nr:hypothetical protein [Halomonas huangheensis]